MSESELLQQIAQKEIKEDKIADKVIEQPELLSEIIEGLNSHEAHIKYGCCKVLRIISEKEPALLYPKIDFFIDHLDSDNNFFKWNAILIVANLSFVDSKNRIEQIFDKYLLPISGPTLITAANTIRGAAKIALAKPKLTDKITQELLKVEKAEYQTTECRNVVLGHVINSFSEFFDQIENKRPVVELIRKQFKNTRSGTRKKAEKFLKKFKA